MKKVLALILTFALMLIQVGAVFAYGAEGAGTESAGTSSGSDGPAGGYAEYSMTFTEPGGLSKDYDGIPVQFPSIEDFDIWQKKTVAPAVFDENGNYTDLILGAYEIVKAGAQWYKIIFTDTALTEQLLDEAPADPGDYRLVINSESVQEQIRQFTGAMADQEDSSKLFYFVEASTEFCIYENYASTEKVWIEYSGNDICNLLFRTVSPVQEELSPNDFTLFRDSHQFGKTEFVYSSGTSMDVPNPDVEQILYCAVWHRTDENGEIIEFTSYDGETQRYIMGPQIPTEPGHYTLTLGYCEYDEYYDEDTEEWVLNTYPIMFDNNYYGVVPVTFYFTVSEGESPQHVHSFDSGVPDAMAKGSITYSCGSCGYSYTENPTYSEDNGMGVSMPEGTASVINVNGVPADQQDQFSMNVTAFIPDMKQDAPIISGLENDIVKCTNLDPDSIQQVFDIDLEKDGREYHLTKNESIDFSLNVGFEAAHELAEGTMIIVHGIGNMAEIADVTPDPSTGMADISADSLSPFALVRVKETDYYGRLQLSKMPHGDAYVYAYDRIAEGVENAEIIIKVSNGEYKVPAEDRALVMEAYLNDYPQHFWLDKGYSYSSGTSFNSLYPEYLSGLYERKAEFEAAAIGIIESAGITESAAAGMSDYEKELRIHDALCRHIVYDSTAPNRYSAWGAIIDGRAVCEGETEAFQYLLQKVGIHSHRVTGNSINPANGKSIPHAWNVNKIDGEWYYVDITWDNQVRKAEDLGKDSCIFYSYFNMTTEQCAKNHDIYAPLYKLPECTSEKYNYYTVNSQYDLDTDAATSAAQLQSIGEQLKKRSFARLNVSGAKSLSSWVTSDSHGRSIIGKWLGLSGNYSDSYSFRSVALGNEVHLSFTLSSGLPANCAVSLPSGPGYAITTEPADITSVARSEGFDFSLTLDPDYVKEPSFCVKLNGDEIYPDEGIYRVRDVAADLEISVSGIREKERYHIEAESGDGYIVSSVSGSDTIVDSCGSYKFTVDVDNSHIRDTSFSVEANSTPLIPDSSGVYAIHNIEENQTITVSGVIPKSSLVKFGNVCITSGMKNNLIAEFGSNGKLLKISFQDFSSYEGQDGLTIYYCLENEGAVCKLFSLDDTFSLLGWKNGQEVE